MTTTEEIRRAAAEKANSLREEIILAVYGRMIREHNDFCGCNYCALLEKYVRMKKHFSALKRTMNFPDYDYTYNDNVAHDIMRAEEMKEKIKALKAQKDHLKTF